MEETGALAEKTWGGMGEEGPEARSFSSRSVKSRSRTRRRSPLWADGEDPGGRSRQEALEERAGSVLKTQGEGPSLAAGWSRHPHGGRSAPATLRSLAIPARHDEPVALCPRAVFRTGQEQSRKADLDF